MPPKCIRELTNLMASPLVSVLDFAQPVAPPSRSVVWPSGRFEWGMRPTTNCVENRLEAKNSMLLVTLEGGARRIRQFTNDGLAYDGPDVAGSFTFLPRGCSRELTVNSVAWHWGVITFPITGLKQVEQSVHARKDDFLRELFTTMRDAASEDETLDVAYLETAGLMAMYYLQRRYTDAGYQPPAITAPLNRKQLSLLQDYVQAHIREPLRIAHFAELLGMSTGHFHRRFVATTGTTPLRWIGEQRIATAKVLLKDRGLSVLEISLAVGIASPSRFARQFRQVTGLSPRDYRREFCDF